MYVDEEDDDFINDLFKAVPLPKITLDEAIEYQKNIGKESKAISEFFYEPLINRVMIEANISLRSILSDNKDKISRDAMESNIGLSNNLAIAQNSKTFNNDVISILGLNYWCTLYEKICKRFVDYLKDPSVRIESLISHVRIPNYDITVDTDLVGIGSDIYEHLRGNLFKYYKGLTGYNKKNR